jgi:hypothetical protein
VKSIYEEYNELEDSKERFLSFGKDYKDCLAPIYCLYKYILTPKKAKYLEQVNKKPLSTL